MTSPQLGRSGAPRSRQPAAGGVVLGPARREELAEVVDCYPGQWVIVGPCAGGQWFAFPHHAMTRTQPRAVMLAGLARLQREHRPQPTARPTAIPRPDRAAQLPVPPDGHPAAMAGHTPPPLTPLASRPERRPPAASADIEGTG
jgi:hypothetical protein